MVNFLLCPLVIACVLKLKTEVYYAIKSDLGTGTHSTLTTKPEYSSLDQRSEEDYWFKVDYCFTIIHYDGRRVLSNT
jgi:hypothetical protein